MGVIFLYFLLVANVQSVYAQTGSQPSPTTKQSINGAQAKSGSAPSSAIISPSPSDLAANLIATPDSLSFEETVNVTNASQTVVLTNKSPAPLKVTISPAAGDFKSESDCQNLTANASCAITVTFTPTHVGEASSSLSINVALPDSTNITKLVSLKGTGLQQCKTFGAARRSAKFLVLLVAIYFIALVLVRWHMIAKPTRAQLVAQIKTILAWTEAEGSLAQVPAQDKAERIKQIKVLLGIAGVPFNNRKFKVTPDNDLVLPLTTRIFNAIFWTRGAELAGWTYSHQAEQQLVALLSAERLRAWMETAETELKQFKTVEADAMADRLHAALQPSTTVTLSDLQAVLIEALSLIYTQRDIQFDLLAGWHNKMMWLVSCALLFIIAVGLTFQNAVLMLIGAVGGLLSRLMQTLSAAKVSNDYGASWGALFLSPLTGALAAWAGVLLLILAGKLQILGRALTFDWCNPYEPATLAVALLLGFTERLFDNLVTQIEPKLLPTASPSQPSAPAAPKPLSPPPATSTPPPTISSLNPPQSKLGQESKLTIQGANFQPNITATVTDNEGKPTKVPVEYKDSSTLIVTFTPAGTADYSSTLTVTNPDQQSVPSQFKVGH